MTSLWRADGAVVAGSPFEPGQHHDVIVVGAGITGLSTALMLVRERAGCRRRRSRRGRQPRHRRQHREAVAAAGEGALDVAAAPLRRARPRVRRRQPRRRTNGSRTSPTRPACAYTRRTAYSYAQSDAGDPRRRCGVRRRARSGTGRAPGTARRGRPVPDRRRGRARRPGCDRSAGASRSPWPVRSWRPAERCTPAPRLCTCASCRAPWSRPPQASPPPSGGAGDRGAHHVSRLLLRQDPRTAVVLRRVRRAGEVPDGLYLSVDGPTRSLRSVTPPTDPRSSHGWSSAATATRSAARSPSARSSTTSSTGRAGTSPAPSRSCRGRLRTTSRTI